MLGCSFVGCGAGEEALHDRGNLTSISTLGVAEFWNADDEVIKGEVEAARA